MPRWITCKFLSSRALSGGLPELRASLILAKAYLTLCFDEGEGNIRDLICLHCEPYEDSNDFIIVCQRNPHLHIKAAKDPLPKSHFPINITEDKILNSLGPITNTFKKAISVLNYEVLQRCS